MLIDWNPVCLSSKVFEDRTEMEYFLNNVRTYQWNALWDDGRPVVLATAEKQQELLGYKDKIAMYYGRWAEIPGGEKIVQKMGVSF